MAVGPPKPSIARPTSAPTQPLNTDFVAVMTSPCSFVWIPAASGSPEWLRGEIPFLEEFQRARMVWHAVLLVAEGRRPFAQHGLHRNQFVLVLLHEIENFVDEVV